MEELKPEYQEALYLVYFEDMSYQGTAEVMGRSKSQLKNPGSQREKESERASGEKGI